MQIYLLQPTHIFATPTNMGMILAFLILLRTDGPSSIVYDGSRLAFWQLLGLQIAIGIENSHDSIGRIQLTMPCCARPWR
jgi:hypothetical protein